MSSFGEPIIVLLLLICLTSFGSVELRFAGGTVSNHVHRENHHHHHQSDHHDHHDSNDHEEEDPLQVRLRVDNYRLLVDGTTDNLVLNKVRQNVENWLLSAVGPVPDDVRVKLLENGSVYVSTTDKALRMSLQKKVRELLENYQDFLTTVDPTKPLTPPPSTEDEQKVQVTDDGKVLINVADDYQKETVKKQVEDLLNNAKIVPSPRFRFYVRPDGSVSSFGSFNPREKELVESSVRNWLKKNKDLFNDYDPENPPQPDVVVPVTVTVRPDGSVLVQTNDPRERQVVVAQVLEWVGRHLPSVDAQRLTFDSETGVVKVSGPLSLLFTKYVRDLLLKNKELFKKYDPSHGLPHDVHTDVKVQVTDDGRILVESPDCLKDSLRSELEEWLLSAFPGLADKIKLELLDDGTVEVVGNVPEATKKLVRDRLWTLIDAHRDELENYPNSHQLPELDGGVAVYVQNDGHLLIEGSDYVKNEAKRKIQEWLRTAFPKLSNNVRFVVLDNGAVDVVGTNDNDLKDKLKKFVRDILLEYAQDLETFDPLVGLEPIKPLTKLSVTNDGRLLVEAPAPLKKSVTEAVQDWLLKFLPELKGKVQLVLLNNGAVEVRGNVDPALKKNAQLVLKDMLLNNKAAVADFDVTKPLLVFGWRPEVTVTDDGRLLVTGPPNLVKLLKKLLQQWLQSYFPSLTGKAKLKVQDDGQVTVDGKVDPALRAQVQDLVKRFLSDNKPVVEKLNLLTVFPKLEWKAKVTVTPDVRVLIEGPASLKKLAKQVVENWLAKYLPKLPGVTLTVQLNEKGELVVGGTQDQVLKDKVKWYLEDLLKSNQKVFENFDVTRPLPVFKWQPDVSVTNDGKVKVEGPQRLKEAAKLLVEAWLQDFLPNLKGKFTVKVLPDGSLQVDGPLDAATKEAVKAFLKNLLLSNKSVFKNFNLFVGLPKLEYGVKVVVDPSGKLLFTGPADLVQQAKVKVQNWLQTFFPTLEGMFTVVVQNDGSLTVNGNVDDSLRSKLLWFLKDLLQNNANVLANYDPVSPLKTFVWTVSTKVTDEGKLLVVASSNGLKNKVKETVLEWVRKNFPELDAKVVLTLDDTGDVLVTGPVSEASKAETRKDVLELFLNNKYVLNTWDWFKPLAVTLTKASVTLDPNGNVKLSGPSSKKSKIRKELLEWLRRQLPLNDVNVVLDLNDNNELVVSGTTDPVLAERVKGFLRALLKNNQDAVNNYNKVNSFPNLDWTPKLTVTVDGRVVYSGPDALKNTVDDELNKWLQSAFPQVGKDVTYKRGPDGVVLVVGTTDEALKAKLSALVKEFLLTKKNTVDNYNVLYGFPAPAWTLTVSVSATGKLVFTGPKQLADRAKNDVQKWLKQAFPSLGGNVNFVVLDDGSVDVVGVSDETVKNRLRQNVQQVLTTKKSDLESYNVVYELAPLVWKVSVKVETDGRVNVSGPSALVNTVLQDLAKWVRSAFPTLGSTVELTFGLNGEVVVTGTNDPVLVEKLKQLVKSLLLANKPEAEAYDGFKGLSRPNFNVNVNVLPNGSVTFDGVPVLVNNAKKDLVDWLVRRFPSLASKLVLNGNEVDLVNVSDPVEKKKKLDLVQQFLARNADVLKQYDLLFGFPAPNQTGSVTVGPDGNLQVSGPSPVTESLLKDLADWLLLAFPTLNPNVRLGFSSSGAFVVTGANDPALADRLRQLVKALLLNYKPDVEAYDGFKTLPKPDFNVNVSGQPNGVVTFNILPALVNTAKNDFLDWLAKNFPSLASKVVLNGNQVDLVGFNDPEEKKAKLDLLKLFLDSNLDVLKKYNPLTGFPAPTKTGTLTVSPDAKLVVSNPSPLTDYLLQKVSEWVRSAFPGLDANVVVSFDRNGEVLVTGTNNPALVNRLKQLVKKLLQSYKPELDAFDGFKDLPKPEFNVVVSEQLNGVVTFDGTPALVNNAKQDFLDWLVQRFPSLASKVVFNGNKVDLVGFDNPEEKKRKLDLVRLFLDNNADVLRKYQPWLGFPAPNKSGTLTVSPDGSVVVNDPSPLTDSLLQDLAKWVRSAFPSLDFNVVVGFTATGEVTVTGSNDPVLVERLKQLVKALLLTYKTVVETYDGFKDLPKPEFSVTVSVQQNGAVTFDGSPVLVNNARKDLLDWLAKVFPSLASKLVLNGNQVDLVGVDNPEEKKRKLDLVRLFLANNADVLKKYQPLTGFPAPTKSGSVTVGPDGSLVVTVPSAVTNNLLQDLAQWARAAFPSMDANVRFQFSVNGEVTVTGTNDQVLVDRLKQLLKSLFLQYKVVVESYDGFTVLPTVTWTVSVTVTAEGYVKFVGPVPATNLAQKEFLKWLQSFFADLNVSFTLSESGVVGVTGTNDATLVARVLLLVQQLLTEYRTELANYDVVRGFKAGSLKVDVVVNADGSVKATGSPGLVAQFYQDLAKWLTSSFAQLPSGVTVSFTTTGSLQVTGVSDPNTLSLLQQLFREFLVFNSRVVQQYNFVSGFARVDWRVLVTVQGNGSLQVSAPQPLLATVRAQLEAWLNRLFAPLQGKVTFTLQDNGEVVLGGSLPKPLADRVQQFLVTYLLSNKAQLAAFSVFTPLPVDLAAPTVTVTNDGRLLLAGPEYWTSQARSDFQTWVQNSLTLQFAATVTLTSSGEFQFSGTTDAALLADAKARLQKLLATYKRELTAYNLFTPLPKVELELVLSVTPGYGINFAGANAEQAKKNVLKWLEQSFPSLAGQFTLQLQPNGQVVVVSTQLNESLRSQLQTRVTLLVKEYQALLKKYTLDVPLPKVVWEVSVTIGSDNSFKIEGPSVLTAKTRQQILYLLIKAIPSLDGNIEIEIKDNGKVLILGTTDQEVIKNIRSQVLEIMKSHANLLINVYVDVPVNSGPVRRRRMMRRRGQ